MRTTLLPLFALCLVACAGPRQGEVVFPATYSPSGGILPPALPSCSSPIQVTVTDGRRDPSLLGRRFEEEKPTVDYPLRMSGDVMTYVRNGIERGLQRAGGKGASGPTAATLAVNVTQFLIEEKMFRNSEYYAQIALESVLTLPGSSQPCWKGFLRGSGNNYGRAGNPENYLETLNRALDQAVANLLSPAPGQITGQVASATPGFADALCGRCSDSLKAEAWAPTTGAHRAPGNPAGNR